MAHVLLSGWRMSASVRRHRPPIRSGQRLMLLLPGSRIIQLSRPAPETANNILRSSGSSPGRATEAYPSSVLDGAPLGLWLSTSNSFRGSLHLEESFRAVAARGKS